MSPDTRPSVEHRWSVDPEGEPTDGDLHNPVFLAVWDAIKSWDISRGRGRGYAASTGTDVMTILRAIRSAGDSNGN